MPGGERAEVVHGAAHVEVRAGPAAARVADAPVLDVPGRDAVGGERVSHRGEIPAVGIRRLEAAAVDQRRDGMRAGAVRDPELAELQRVGAV